jgi:hypothetical protein
MACEVCGFIEACGGCMAGTDPKVPERLEKLKQMMGAPCAVSECAMNNKIDYCLRCDKFPCEVHYQGLPYSKKLLDIFKKFKEGR